MITLSNNHLSINSMTLEHKPHPAASSGVKHLAIGMDGNRRWAVEHGLPKLLGHTEGAKALKKIATAAVARGIPFLTVYTLSTENLKERGAEELDHLFGLFNQLTNYLADFLKNNVRFRVIGDLTGLPEKTQTRLHEVMEKTAEHTALTLTLAINYGGRDEIVRAARRLLAAEKTPDTISEAVFGAHLDTAEYPDVDLMIRTGARHRLLNFLLWQVAYAELYFTDTMWPAFDETELDRALAWFAEQKRTRGK